MQTTLLGLAIALILALVSALVAPLVVDWNHYRTAFEAEASRLTGLTVRVNGTIEARILPTPLIKLRDVEVAQADGEPRLRAGTLELEVGLGPLLRGEVRASEVHLIAPQISLGLDRSGAIDWPVASPSFNPETLSISRLNIEDGRVTLTDAASGSRLVLQKLWFNGDIRSLVGPFKGEGAFVAGDELYGYRISGNRAEGGAGFKIKFGVDPSNHPLTTDIDGTLTFDRGVPQFEGTLALARPVGATLGSGQRVMNEPWHAGGRFQVTPIAASLQDFALQYGPDERAINFTGKAQLDFGAHPHLDGVVSGLQVDIDRALAAPDVTHRRPLIVIGDFFASLMAAVKLPMPVRIGVGIDAVTIGGTTIQSLHGDLRYDAGSWRLDRLAFRAPGFTQVNLSGALKDTPQGVAFTGPATLEAADVNMLLAWLKGRGDLPSGQANTLSARGDLTIGRDRLAVDRLSASLDQENVEGDLAYTWATDTRPAILNADLRAAVLDLDALTAFAKTAVADNGFEVPHEAALALDIGKATYAGIDARAVKAQIKFDAGVLQIDRLSVGELGGAALGVTGRIDELSSRPRGRVALDLDATALGGLANVVGKFAPQAADVMRRFADRLAPAKLHAILNVERATAGSSAKLTLDGQMGLLQVALTGDATGDPSHFGAAQVRLDSRLDAADGKTLLALLGLDRFVAVDQLPGRATLSAEGPLNGDLRVDGQVSASGFDTALRGKMHFDGAAIPAATLQILASVADLRPLHEMMTGQPGADVPVSARAALAIAGNALSFTDLAVAAGKSSARGRLRLTLSNPVAIDGDIGASDVDGVGVSAMLLGLPDRTPGTAAPWSSQPVGSGAFTAMSGSVTFKLDRATFTPALVASDLKGVAHFRPAEIAFDDLDGHLAGGRLTGALAFRRDVNGLAAHGRLALADADAATILTPRSNAVDGKLTIKLQSDGIGHSPAGLIGSLHGSGFMTLVDGRLAAIDPAVFAAAIGAADQNGSIEPPKVLAVVSDAMANGHLAVPHGDAALTITSGQVNVANVTLQAQDGAALTLNGVIDLNNDVIDARMTLSGRPPANALIRTRPELDIAIKGPLAAPQRTLNASALTAWLTLRAAELQTRRLESIEANRREGATGPVTRPESPPVRVAPLGAVVESAVPSNGPVAPAPGVRALERLQPQPPPAPPNETRSDSNSGNADRIGVPAADLAAPVAIKPSAPRPPHRTDSANATAPAVEQNGHRVAPQPSPAQPAAPAVTEPARRPPLDLLFRPQH